jgi:hypothetical protein
MANIKSLIADIPIQPKKLMEQSMKFHFDLDVLDANQTINNLISVLTLCCVILMKTASP